MTAYKPARWASLFFLLSSVSAQAICLSKWISTTTPELDACEITISGQNPFRFEVAKGECPKGCEIYVSQKFETARKKFQRAMDESGLKKDEQERFWPLLKRYISGDRGFVEWQTIERLAVGDPQLISYEQAITSLKEGTSLSDLAVIKLNGGLGTGMGLEGPKTLLKVTPEDTFLSVILGQLQVAKKASGSAVPLIFMNSYNTDEETKSALKELGSKADGITIFHMNQGTFLRIKSGDEAEPLSLSAGQERFNPPGHGDVYNTLKESGLLKKLLHAGKKYALISNGDNLGATPDPGILAYLREHKIPFLLEVTPRTENDRKGGTVCLKKSEQPTKQTTEKLLLLELANVDASHQKDFQDLQQFPVFNTNNLWVDLEALNKRLANSSLEMDLIVNPKEALDQGKKVKVVQLEQAMGSAVSSFPGAVAMVVPRTRFRPVKTTNELFLLRSGLFTYSNGVFQATAKDEGALPIISLGDHFKKISEFEKRFPQIPEISGLKSLKVEGNLYFGKSIVLEGNVVIKTETLDKPVKVPDGAHLSTGTHIY